MNVLRISFSLLRSYRMIARGCARCSRWSVTHAPRLLFRWDIYIPLCAHWLRSASFCSSFARISRTDMLVHYALMTIDVAVFLHVWIVCCAFMVLRICAYNVLTRSRIVRLHAHACFAHGCISWICHWIDAVLVLPEYLSRTARLSHSFSFLVGLHVCTHGSSGFVLHSSLSDRALRIGLRCTRIIVRIASFFFCIYISHSLVALSGSFASRVLHADLDISRAGSLDRSQSFGLSWLRLLVQFAFVGWSVVLSLRVLLRISDHRTHISLHCCARGSHAHRCISLVLWSHTSRVMIRLRSALVKFWFAHKITPAGSHFSFVALARSAVVTRQQRDTTFAHSFPLR